MNGTEMSDIPYGAEPWVEFLVDKPLPVRNSVLKQLQKKLRNDQVTIRELNSLIKSDPVLCLQVVRKASELHIQKDSSVTSIDHAINSLGLNHIEELLSKVKPIRLNPSSVSQKMFFRAIAVSHHASHQVQDWLRVRKAPFIEEAALAALFYGVGYWMLWQHAALHMSEIQRKARKEDIDSILAESDILGCTVQEISQGLIERWAISELAVTSLEHENSPNKKTLAQLHQRALGDPRLTQEDLREINHLVQEKFFPVKLSNWLAQNTDFSWYRSKTMHVIDIINDFLKGELQQTLQMLHSNCAAASKRYHVAGTLAPAAEMLMIASDVQFNYCLSKKEHAILSKTHPALRPPEPKPSEEVKKEEAVTAPERKEYLDQSIYTQISERFLKGYNLYTQPKHILQGLIQGINKGLGFERVAMYLINHKQHQLRTALSVGFEDGHPITRFQHDLEIPSLFKKLKEKPGCIWVTPENQEQMLHMLPDTYGKWGADNGFMLMSIFKNGNAVAILHADYGSNGPQISEFHHERFRYLCSAATLALKKL